MTNKLIYITKLIYLSIGSRKYQRFNQSPLKISNLHEKSTLFTLQRHTTQTGRFRTDQLKKDLSPYPKKSHSTILLINKRKKTHRNIKPSSITSVPGNNAQLVRRIMSTRKNWEEINDSKYLFLNFKWQQTNKNYKYQGCIDNKIFKYCLNHFQFHQELTNKEHMFKNLHQYCESQKIDVFDFVPLTFAISVSDSNFQQNQLNFLKVFEHYMPEQMKIPGRKQALSLKKRKHANFKFLQTKQKNINKFPIKAEFLQQKSKYLWILKPTSNNRGNGIHVFNSLQSLQNLMNLYLNGQNLSNKNLENLQSLSPDKKSSGDLNSSPSGKKKGFRIRQYTSQQNKCISSFVIQKYLQKPLLFEDRKFDIRMWVLVSHEMKVYLFKQGYIRTSSYKYSTNEDQILDLNVHLTNNAVQKHNTEYGKYEDGNQLSFKALKAMVQNQGRNYTQLMNKIKWIIKVTMLSAKKKINKNERSFCFQIFGYDFMLDKQCKPWLIEINTNPCIQQSSTLLQNLLPRMLDDAFCLTLDRIFETEKKGYNYSLQNQYSTDNLWQPITDLKKPAQTAGTTQVISLNSSHIY